MEEKKTDKFDFASAAAAADATADAATVIDYYSLHARCIRDQVESTLRAALEEQGKVWLDLVVYSHDDCVACVRKMGQRWRKIEGMKERWRERKGAESQTE